MASTAPPQVLDRNLNRQWLNAFIRKYAIVLIFIVMFIGMTFLTDAFLQPRNLVNVVRQISVVGLIAIGVTMVIITTGLIIFWLRYWLWQLSSRPAWPTARLARCKYPG